MQEHVMVLMNRLGTKIGREGPFHFPLQIGGHGQRHIQSRPDSCPNKKVIVCVYYCVCLTPHICDATAVDHGPHPLKLKCSYSSVSVRYSLSLSYTQKQNHKFQFGPDTKTKSQISIWDGLRFWTCLVQQPANKNSDTLRPILWPKLWAHYIALRPTTFFLALRPTTGRRGKPLVLSGLSQHQT